MAEYNRLAPAQFIPLTFQLFDGTNAPTRYIQAVIINATTRAVIATKNLTDNGNGDFSLFSVTPASLSIGENNFFEVITTVYSDSGYTTVDPDYAVEKEIYYVKEETSGAILGGSGGSFPQKSSVEKVDYKKLVRMIWKSKEAQKLFKNDFYRKLKIDINKLQKSIDNDTGITNLAELLATQYSIIIEAIQNIANNTAPDETLESLENIRNQLLVFLKELPNQVKIVQNVPKQIKNTEKSINKNLKDNYSKVNSLLDSLKRITDIFKSKLVETHNKNKEDLQGIKVGLELEMVDFLNEIDKQKNE